jgi:hypothetical protein
VSRLRIFFVRAAAALVAIGGAPVSAQSLPPGVDECVQRIRQEAPTESGADAARLGDLCPELAVAINEGPWGDEISGVWADDLAPNAFLQLAELVSSYQRPADGGLALSSASLDESVAALKLQKPPGVSLWERIQQWFDEWFGRRTDTQGWLQKWLEHLSPSERVVRYLVVVLGLVLVAATVVVVVNELRVAGVLAGDAIRKYSPLARSAPGAADSGPRDLDAVGRAPFARRPVLLLALVLERLRARGRTALRDSLTHRELLGAAGNLTAEQNAALAVVVGGAERVTFGDWRPEEREVDDIVASGRTLLASLPADEGAGR